ncbi:hypothetical protein PAXRUDRAFT_155197, partial [Paxillus rubicundulus Ve08.2h10]
PSTVDSGKTQNQFWFQDGNIDLKIESKYFKVHWDRLMTSLVFATMLELPQPELVESHNGCPLVQLSQDAIQDWTTALSWMYDRRRVLSFEVFFSTALDIIAGALRISTKYEISDLRLWCKQQRWEKGIDGGRSHLTLSPDDLRRLIIGREELQERLTDLLTNLDSRANSVVFRLCQPPCMTWLSSQLLPPSHSPYG